MCGYQDSAGTTSFDPMRAVRLTAATVIVASLLVISPATAWAAKSTKLTISASAKSASVTRKVTLAGTLKLKSGRPVASRKIRLERYNGSKWQLVKQIRTNSKGKASAKVQPGDDAKYRFRYAGSKAYKKSTSKTKSVGGYKAPTKTFAGSGSQVVGPFTLEKGLSVATSVPGPTDTNFIITLYDSEGNYVSLLANEIGAVSSTRAVKISMTGKYFLEVESDTDWQITVRQPRQLSAPSTRSFSGGGTSASGLFKLSKSAYKFSWKNTGSSNFIVVLLDHSGNWVDLIANEIGSSSGSALVQVPASGLYMLDVEADGPWSVECASP